MGIGGSTPSRCAWAGTACAGLRAVPMDVPAILGGAPGVAIVVWVDPAHESAVRDYVASARRLGGVFRALLLLSVVGATVGVVVGLWVWPPARWLAPASILVLGLGVVAMPFPTPQTVALMSLRAARTLGRAAGVALVLVGLMLAWIVARH